MAYFSDLNDNLNFVVSKVLENQDLCKYLYYNVADPLLQPDIPDTRSTLLMDNIFPLPKDPGLIEDQMSILNIYFPFVKPYTPNSGFRKIELCFDIMCHLDLWNIDDGIRVYCIANQIDSMFNNKFYGELSFNANFFDRAAIRKFSDRFYGWQVIYQISNDSNVGC